MTQLLNDSILSYKEFYHFSTIFSLLTFSNFYAMLLKFFILISAFTMKSFPL